MNKRRALTIFLYGLLQWFILLATLFVASLIVGVKEGAEMTAPPPLGFVIVAIVMVFVAIFFGRRLKPTSRKQALIAGVVWSGMTTLFMVVTVVGNGTQSVIFGNWGSYLLYVAQAIGTMFVRAIPIRAGNPSLAG